MSPNRFPSNPWRGRGALAVAIALGAGMWLGVLPLVGRQPAVREYIEGNEQRGINPGAKFYTELPCMPGIYDRVQRARQR